MVFKRKDKVRIRETGAEEVVTAVAPLLYPPIWLTDNCGYCESDLELVQAAPIPSGKIKVIKTCHYSIEVDCDSEEEALRRAEEIPIHDWDETWLAPGTK